MTREEFEMLVENPTSDPLEAVKDEARAEGYQQGYLDALNDIELRLNSLPYYVPVGETFWESTEQLRKMVLSK